MNLADACGFDSTPDSELVTIRDRGLDWRNFLESYYKKQLSKLSRQYPKLRSLTIDYRDVVNHNPEMADEVLYEPDKVLGDIRGACIGYSLVHPPKRTKVEQLNIRFTNIPVRVAIRDIRTNHIGLMISIEGIVRKVNDVRPRLVKGLFRCPAGHPHYIEQGYGSIDIPDRCPTEGCTQRKLELVPKASFFLDNQKARLQEAPEGLAGGAQPQTIDVDILDDTAGILNAGDRVIINGIIRTHHRTISGQKSTIFDIYLECNSIELPEQEYSEIEISYEDEQEILETAKDPMVHLKIRDSIAPSIYGNENVKEAISLSLFGGTAKELPDSRIRGDIHVLMFGDPGIAKSQLLKYVVMLSPRGIFTSGQSSTNAGMTATAVKDEFGDGRWTLEAGALVLADMGIVAVDEMDKMPQQVQVSVLEAMEQQTVTVTKAGMNVALKSRCALLGAANPTYGRFDAMMPMAKQFNMSAPLLSRFDLIFLTTDVPETTRDSQLATHILNSHKVGQEIMRHKAGIKPKAPDVSSISPVLPIKFLRKYVAFSKKHCIPLLTKEAQKILLEYYVRVRGLADSPDKPVPITARSLEALVRLAEASARQRLSDEITTFDAERVVSIVDACLRQVAYDSPTGYDVDGIVTGLSKLQRDLTETIKHTINQLSEGGEHPEEHKVIGLVVNAGFQEHKVVKRIDQMKKENTLSEPRNGRLKVV